MKKVIFEDENYKIVLINGGLYILIPKYRCTIKDWHLSGGAYAISVPEITGFESSYGHWMGEKSAKELGRRGGEITKEKFGKDFFKKISKLGVRARNEKNTINTK